MIRTQFPDKGLSRELREFYEKFEYHVTKYTPTELKNYRMHKGLYPVIDLDLEKKSAVILYAASRGTYPEDHPGFKYSVQFQGKEESEGFFTPDTAEKIIESSSVRRTARHIPCRSIRRKTEGIYRGEMDGGGTDYLRHQSSSTN